MGYREEAIECVRDYVLPLHKQIYAKYDGDLDRIYSEGYNSKTYQGRVIESGKEYELSYLECSCPKVKCGLRSNKEPPIINGDMEMRFCQSCGMPLKMIKFTPI